MSASSSGSPITETSTAPPQSLDLLDFAESDRLAGFRMRRIELYNWGTFHDRIWSLPMDGKNALLTGDIGSGKSTLVDAITTLLVPAHRVSYNKAAGAEFRERDLRSYVLGYYKSERSEAGYAARPVALRDRNSYSVILGVFYNAGFDKTVTLAQVFHQRESQGQPARFYIVSDSDLSIGGHFSGFGSDIGSLKKRLRKLPHTEPPFESFPAYGAAFRRRFGLQSEQALELFHQTVSMKAVGNLTEFVREHMLESFDVSPRIEALITHFDDLNRAHESVLRAKDQIARLTPLIDKLDKYEAATARREQWRFCRDGLRTHFSALKADLLRTRIDNYRDRIHRYTLARDEKQSAIRHERSRRDELKQAIAENGGDQIENLRKERATAEQEKTRRSERFEQYAEICRTLDLPLPEGADTFVDNQAAVERLLTRAEQASNDALNRRSELEVNFRDLRGRHAELSDEIESLRTRRSNIDSKQIAIRERLCEALEIDDAALPFAGELISVREEAKEWEGAIERLLRNFGMSLLVPEEMYEHVSDWVDRTHLRGRLVYFRVREEVGVSPDDPDTHSLLRKIEVKPDSRLRDWLGAELARRFDYTCCETMEQFRRSRRALTKSGQVKGSAVRHEKDDRHRIDDRSRYVLGWRNDEKIRVLNTEKSQLEQSIADLGEEIAALQNETSKLEDRKRSLYRLQGFVYFEDIYWQPLAERIAEIDEEIASLERSSDVLADLRARLDGTDSAIDALEKELEGIHGEIKSLDDRRESAEAQLSDAEETCAASDTPLEELAEQIEPLRGEALGSHQLTVESCDNRQQDLREWIQGKIDAEDRRLRNLQEQIGATMSEFRRDYPAETREMDASIEAGDEYRKLLDRLKADDLPKFEERFKALLNENTIREIANFQAQLNKEYQIIRERITRINQSMSAIEFNKDRYIRLEANNTNDVEIKSFRQELKKCTEGSFTGSTDEQYTEEKYLQVKSIIDRFKGREGSTEIDRRWTEKVTDVRNWFSFAASERWKEDDTEYEHYTDSGGKSGGQKEKLAYTVLAASLAYQFGLEWGETRSRSFRFVAIDEAFGKGSDESTRYGLRLFKELNLQLLIITPLQKIHIIEPYVSTVGFVHTKEGRESLLRCLTIEEYQREKEARGV